MNQYSYRSRVMPSTSSSSFAGNHRFDPCMVKIIFVQCEGGKCTMGACARVGALGFSPRKCAQEIVKLTQSYVGMEISVKLTVRGNKIAYDVIPSVETLIVKELKSSGAVASDFKTNEAVAHKVLANLSMDQILTIARHHRPRSSSDVFSGTVKEVFIAAMQMHCTVDGLDPGDFLDRLTAGHLRLPKE